MNSRKEFEKALEERDLKLARYESKLRDVVVAYKGVIKEKEALEKALQASRSVSFQNVNPESESNEATSYEVEATADDDNTNQKEPCKADETQIAALSELVDTLKAERDRVVEGYQLEIKHLKKTGEEAELEHLSSIEQKNKELSSLNSELKKLKVKLRSQQHDRELEQNDHAVQLRELQKLVAYEREDKEKIEMKIESMQLELDKRERVSDVQLRYESRIRDLINEISALKGRLSLVTKEANKPSPMFLQLQQQIIDLKSQHRLAMAAERQRSSEAESRLRLVETQSEERVTCLEAKISEFSDIIGNYEKLRQEDQGLIERLRERIEQLDLDNNAASRTAGKPSHEVNDIHEQMDDIVEAMKNLQETNLNSSQPVDCQAFVIQRLLVGGEESLHEICQRDYDQLREEFERYKLRAQSVLKTKTKDSSGSASQKEVDALRAQITELTAALTELKTRAVEEAEQHRADLSRLHLQRQQQQERHSSELEEVKAEADVKAATLEQELTRHRERTVALLAEKEVELQACRSAAAAAATVAPGCSGRMSRLSAGSTGDSFLPEDGPILDELLSSSSASTLGSSVDPGLLHYAAEQARKDGEISSLRRQKHQLESAIHELQQSLSARDLRYAEKCEKLRQQMEDLRRGRGRDSANLEYLKNVVFRYMTSSNKHSRLNMLKAISTILQFSPDETLKVEQHLAGWWGSTATTAVKSGGIRSEQNLPLQ